MRRKLRIAALIVCALGLAGGASADSLPQGGGANNVVVAQTTADGSTLVRAATQVTQVGGPTVTSANIANATATSCTGCHSTAVAVQVVLVTSSPQYFAPGNAATAVNAGCSSCGTFAYAWQYVLQTSRPVALSAAAQEQVLGLKQEIARAAASVVPDSVEVDAALRAELDGLTAELKAVVDADVQRADARVVGTPLERVHSSFGS